MVGPDLSWIWEAKVSLKPERYQTWPLGPYENRVRVWFSKTLLNILFFGIQARRWVGGSWGGMARSALSQFFGQNSQNQAILGILGQVTGLVGRCSDKNGPKWAIFGGLKIFFRFSSGHFSFFGSKNAQNGHFWPILGENGPVSSGVFGAFNPREEHFSLSFWGPKWLGKMSPGRDPAISFGNCDGKTISAPSEPDTSQGSFYLV